MAPVDRPLLLFLLITRVEFIPLSFIVVVGVVVSVEFEVLSSSELFESSSDEYSRVSSLSSNERIWFSFFSFRDISLKFKHFDILMIK